jgi:hypothetical protein
MTAVWRGYNRVMTAEGRSARWCLLYEEVPDSDCCRQKCHTVTAAEICDMHYCCRDRYCTVTAVDKVLFSDCFMEKCQTGAAAISTEYMALLIS